MDQMMSAATVAEFCARHGISELTFHRYREWMPRTVRGIASLESAPADALMIEPNDERDWLRCKKARFEKELKRTQ